MNENNNNWFYRNRTFLFGFTAVLIVLYIVISMLVPHQTPVAWTGEATEYAVNDDDFAEVHTVALEGTLTVQRHRRHALRRDADHLRL